MRHRLTASFAALAIALIGAGCTATPSPTANPHSPETSIKTLQEQTGLPDQPIQFSGMVTMDKSPDGTLQVGLYKDSEGRKYSIEPKTDQVVEMDARDVPLNPENTQILSEAELRATAEKLVRVLLPGFDSMTKDLDLITGTESDTVYSFWWRAKNPGDWPNPPNIQLAFNVNGDLVGYVNTLILPQ